MISMEKIDYVINRTGASYSIVRHALLEFDGDVDEAIKYIEQNKVVFVDNKEEKQEKEKQADYIGSVFNSIDEIIDAIREIWKKGNARRLLVEKNDETILSLSLATSAIGLILGPVAAVVGFGTAYLGDYEFKIIMEDGDIIDIKEYIKEKGFKK
ncbi:MAG: DUF4342 domain-containing protein [Tissierellia bacterium]|nr:DUF4342 domain-containing protein [Tissierellia bacterium]